jgi:hypothetical protein
MKRFSKSLRKIKKYSNTKKDQRCLMVQRHSAKMVLSRVAYGFCQVRVHLVVWIALHVILHRLSDPCLVRENVPRDCKTKDKTYHQIIDSSSILKVVLR